VTHRNSPRISGLRTALRARRQALGLTQAEVARRAGISRSYYAQIELGQRTPPVDLALRIARILGGDVAELFGPVLAECAASA